MKKDIHFPKVEGVSIAIGRQRNDVADGYEYTVFLINQNDFPIENILVNSSGYSDDKKTSTLRQFIRELAGKSSVKVETIHAELFDLVNQFWVSYYVGVKLYDKKFLFLPESITEENFAYIEAIKQEGVLHA